MSLQFGFFAQLTWGEYSWDIMEPVTYFTTCATLIGIYVYFALIRQVQYNIQCTIRNLSHDLFSVDKLCMFYRLKRVFKTSV